jgi:hypothetical protein
MKAEVRITRNFKKEAKPLIKKLHDNMPTLLRFLGFRFFFYSNEGKEPPHVHIEKGDAEGKFWLDPVEEEYMDGFTKSEEKQVRKIIEEHQQNFKNNWHEHFNS